ncbi:MAG: LysM peptidoglycan-binding domain-containing protein [Chloroflexi bacterium]|nr:LysM peptidoglycan-binding domain-containing protein [Chloroflexota bacterium]
MNKRIRFLLIIVAGLLASACTRSATSASQSTPTEDPLESVFNTIATQTALAAGSKDPESTLPTTSATSIFGATATLASSPTTIPTATTTPAPITELAVPSSYTLHLGEWPYCLARRFDIDSAALLTANGLTEQQAANLSVGYKLVIPVDEVGTFGAARSLRSHPTTYTASGSDTFYSIACAFGDVWPEHIAEANGMDLDEELPGGMQLYIP